MPFFHVHVQPTIFYTSTERDQLNLWSGKCFKVSTQSESFVSSCYGPLSLSLSCLFPVAQQFCTRNTRTRKKAISSSKLSFCFCHFFYLLTGHIFFLQLSKVTEWTKYVDMLVICVRFFFTVFWATISPSACCELSCWEHQSWSKLVLNLFTYSVYW